MGGRDISIHLVYTSGNVEDVQYRCTNSKQWVSIRMLNQNHRGSQDILNFQEKYRHTQHLSSTVQLISLR